MKLALSRHRILVTVPLGEAALERLDVFFDVDVDIDVDACATGGGKDADAWLARLRDKAGVVTDATVPFDADLVRQLPALRAISLVEQAHDRLDLSALTSAGIRATNVPDGDDADAVAVEGLVASLGFGRRSFHPPYLLNPEVSCTSCC